jgi:hypothetical protein
MPKPKEYYNNNNNNNNHLLQSQPLQLSSHLRLNPIISVLPIISLLSNLLAHMFLTAILSSDQYFMFSLQSKIQSNLSEKNHIRITTTCQERPQILGPEGVYLVF